MDGSDDLSGFQGRWFLGEPNLNFQGSQHELWGNTSWSQSHSSQCGHECMPDACHFSISFGWSHGGSILGLENAWTAYSVKADCLGFSATPRAWNFRNLPRMTSSYLKLFVLLFFCSLFLPPTHLFLSSTRTKKKVRWNLSLFGQEHCPKSTVTFAKVVWVQFSKEGEILG